MYRFYFTSSHPRPLAGPIIRNIILTGEADLLDILSNGSCPAKVMRHINKVLLATASLVLASLQASHVQVVLYPAWAKSKWILSQPYPWRAK